MADVCYSGVPNLVYTHSIGLYHVVDNLLYMYLLANPNLTDSIDTAWRLAPCRICTVFAGLCREC